MGECNVCCSEGRYPVIDRFGSELYTIKCPECYGYGTSEDEDPEAESKAVAVFQRSKYERAMAETRAARQSEDAG